MKKFLVFLMVGVLAAAVFVLPSEVGAQTASDLQAQVTQLRAMVAQLQAALQGITSTSTSTVPTSGSVTSGERTTVLGEVPGSPIVSCFLPEMSYGTRNNSVYLLQTILNRLGYYPEGLITGYYGSLTQAAVRRLQEANNLSVTGIISFADADFLGLITPFKECQKTTPLLPSETSVSAVTTSPLITSVVTSTQSVVAPVSSALVQLSDWTLRFTASGVHGGREISLLPLTIGMRKSATNQFDVLIDNLAPPPHPDSAYPEFYITNSTHTQDWARKLAVDIRSQPTDTGVGETWSITMKNKTVSAWAVRWDASAIPSFWTTATLQVSGGALIHLREASSVSIPTNSTASVSVTIRKMAAVPTLAVSTTTVVNVPPATSSSVTQISITSQSQTTGASSATVNTTNTTSQTTTVSNSSTISSSSTSVTATSTATSSSVSSAVPVTTTTSSGSTTVSGGFCSDSDGGKNHEVFGTATGRLASGALTTETDTCSSATRLLERWCRAGANQSEGYYVDCPYGCRAGACLSSSAPPDWTANFTATGIYGGRTSTLLPVTIGMRATATNQYDVLVDNLAPPPHPDPAYPEFYITNSTHAQDWARRLAVDIRSQPTDTSIGETWSITMVNNTSSTWTVNWTASSFPSYWDTATLQAGGSQSDLRTASPISVPAKSTVSFSVTLKKGGVAVMRSAQDLLANIAETLRAMLESLMR